MVEIVHIDFTNLRLKENMVLDEIGTLVKQEMITRAPKDTHALVASIEKETSDHKVKVGTHGIQYADEVEFFDWTGLPSAAYTSVAKPSPEMPNEVWKALIKRNELGTGQSIPFARSSDFYTRNEQIAIFKKAFK